MILYDVSVCINTNSFFYCPVVDLLPNYSFQVQQPESITSYRYLVNLEASEKMDVLVGDVVIFRCQILPLVLLVVVYARPWALATSLQTQMCFTLILCNIPTYSKCTVYTFT